MDLIREHHAALQLRMVLQILRHAVGSVARNDLNAILDCDNFTSPPTKR